MLTKQKVIRRKQKKLFFCNQYFFIDKEKRNTKCDFLVVRHVGKKIKPWMV
jgi:hypothetical protein